jgi:uncharacterized membrane protein
MRSAARLAGLKEYLRSSLWALPAAFVVAAVVLATVLSEVRPEVDGTLDALVFGGSPEGARELLSALAGAMITVIGLTFSLTVVALQMAAGQFSPRVLRGFLADRGNQVTLSTLVATFAYTIAVLRTIREGGDDGEEVLPEVAVTGAVLLSLVALGMLVYFLHHLTRQLRVETILQNLTDDTLGTIDRVLAEDSGGPSDRADAAPAEPPEEAVAVAARRSGYLQAVNAEGLVRRASEGGIAVRIRPAVGRHVTEGTTIAWAWGTDGASRPDEERFLGDLVHDGLQMGPERTMQQDLCFGLRQIVDVGAKALSTGMNDPTTAVEALSHLSVIMGRIAGRVCGSAVHRDADGAIRLVVTRPTFEELLHLAVDQIRRYGAVEPAVVIALLNLLTDLAELVDHPARRRAVSEQVDRTLAVAAEELDGTDLDRVRAQAALVRDALAGRRRVEHQVLAG